MTQLVQNIYFIAPYLFVAVLIGAVASGIWLIFQLKKSSNYNQFSLSDRLFMKRNAMRLRKMQFH